MNEQPRHILCEMIEQYGASVFDNARRCEGLLRDLCAAYPREVNVLVEAIKQRVPEDLLNTSIPGLTKELTLARLSKRLHDRLAMTEEAARWAVESWALALGVIMETEASRGAASYASTARKTSGTVPAPNLQPYGGHDPSQSPEIRGFRLGMSLNEVLNRFGGMHAPTANADGRSFIRVNKFGASVAGTWEPDFPSGSGPVSNTSSMEELRSLEFVFLDTAVSSIRIEYDGSVKWNSLDEFTRKISELLGLSGTWEQSGELAKVGLLHAKLETQTYRIVAEGKGPVLKLQDIHAESIVKERIAARKKRIAATESHQRRTFNL